MNIFKLWPVYDDFHILYSANILVSYAASTTERGCRKIWNITFLATGTHKKIQSNDNFFNKWSKNISFTDLLHKVGKLVFKHFVSAYNWNVCKTFTARGVGLYQCQNWKSIEDIISIVHQAGTRVCLGIFDRKRREEDIFMCSLNNVSCDRSDWDEPDKNSSEYNLRLCLWLLHFSSSQKNGVRKMPLTLAAKILCIHTGRTCARCPAVALCRSK